MKHGTFAVKELRPCFEIKVGPECVESRGVVD